MPSYQYNQLQIPLTKTDQMVKFLARALGVPPKIITHVRPLRQSLDSRKRRKIQWVYNLGFTTNSPLKGKAETKVSPWDPEKTPWDKMPEPQLKLNKKIHIIGAGPCGMSAGLHLARKGYDVEIIEMGAPVQERFKDIRHFLKQGKLDEKSNILFGEGGAGAFSDGKLTCRTRTPFTEQTLFDWVEAGCPQDILWHSRPHIGTDQLQFIVKRLRELVEEAGGKFRFHQKFEDMRLSPERKLEAIKIEGKWEDCETLLLAVGHSSRPLYRMLHTHGLEMEAKGYAVGFRIEHPQGLINQCQIGDDELLEHTGTAEYSLHAPEWEGTPGAYSFCMCPGGVLIPCAGEQGELATNGMSYSRRNSSFANSGIVVPLEFEGSKSPLEGMDFQREIERKAYDMGGGNFQAPAQRAASFMKGTLDDALPKSSYPSGLKPMDLSDFYPQEITQSIKKSLKYFDKRIPGFIEQGLLVAPETRTSAPVRLPRNDDTFESVNTSGVYPLGEGGGFAGGIISSAADGLNFASKVLPLVESYDPQARNIELMKAWEENRLEKEKLDAQKKAEQLKNSEVESPVSQDASPGKPVEKVNSSEPSDKPKGDFWKNKSSNKPANKAGNMPRNKPGHESGNTSRGNTNSEPYGKSPKRKSGKKES